MRDASTANGSASGERCVRPDAGGPAPTLFPACLTASTRLISRATRRIRFLYANGQYSVVRPLPRETGMSTYILFSQGKTPDGMSYPRPQNKRPDQPVIGL